MLGTVCKCTAKINRELYTGSKVRDDTKTNANIDRNEYPMKVIMRGFENGQTELHVCDDNIIIILVHVYKKKLLLIKLNFLA